MSRGAERQTGFVCSYLFVHVQVLLADEESVYPSGVSPRKSGAKVPNGWQVFVRVLKGERERRGERKREGRREGEGRKEGGRARTRMKERESVEKGRDRQRNRTRERERERERARERESRF